MLFSGKNEKKVVKLVFEQIVSLISIQTAFGKMLDIESDVDLNAKEIDGVSQQSAAANLKEMRRQAEALLFQGAFFPVYREDYLFFMDRVNTMATACINIVRELENIRSITSTEFLGEAGQLNQLFIEAVEAQAQMFQTLHKDCRQAIGLAGRIEEITAKAGHLEIQMKKRIMEDNAVELGDQLLMSELISRFADISGLVSDGLTRLKVMIAKQAV